MNELFFSLIRVAIGTQETLPYAPSKEEWLELYSMTKKQSLVGVVFAALQKLGASPPALSCREGAKNQPQGESDQSEPIEVLAEFWNMPEMLYLTWMGMAAKIQQRNEVMNGYTTKALEHFRGKGFACNILKGQGIAALYRVGSNSSSGSSGLNGSQSFEPEERDLSLLRQSGDIDVWVNCSRKQLYELSRKELGKLEGLTYHHIHYDLFPDVEIEAHTWPSFLTNPFLNKQFQKFCRIHVPHEGGEDTPSLAFNRVFILQHCYGHFCGHGVGFRQLLDYYFVLRTSYEKRSFADEGRKTVFRDTFVSHSSNVEDNSLYWIERLGMARFASALMWVCMHVFGMERSHCICEPNEKDGIFLLTEVMMTGNMGHQDERVDHKKLQSAFGRYLHNIKRDWQIMRIAQSYALWEPLWGIYQFAWCKFIKRKYERRSFADEKASPRKTKDE